MARIILGSVAEGNMDQLFGLQRSSPSFSTWQDRNAEFGVACRLSLCYAIERNSRNGRHPVCEDAACATGSQ